MLDPVFAVCTATAIVVTVLPTPRIINMGLANMNRRSWVSTLAWACAAFAAASAEVYAQSPVARPPVTVLLQFDGDHSDDTLDELKRELSAIVGRTGLSFEYRMRSELGDTSTPSDLVVVKLRGRCRMEKLPPLMDERGPFAFTHVVDGAVLPYSEVACDRVRRSIYPIMKADDRKHGDRVLGRALGRVVAHEIYHMVGKTEKHGSHGAAKPAISGAQLIASELGFDPADIERLHRAR
jgi:hypothetical protein